MKRLLAIVLTVLIGVGLIGYYSFHSQQDDLKAKAINESAEAFKEAYKKRNGEVPKGVIIQSIDKQNKEWFISISTEEFPSQKAATAVYKVDAEFTTQVTEWNGENLIE